MKSGELDKAAYLEEGSNKKAALSRSKVGGLNRDLGAPLRRELNEKGCTLGRGSLPERV